MLMRRVIACLDVSGGEVVKGIRFDQLRRAGRPAPLAEAYAREGADEIVLLDIAATREARVARLDAVRATADGLFIPLTVGGGIRGEDDVAAVMDAGADKIAVNTAALAEPALIERVARRYGSQAVVVAIDAARVNGVPMVRTRAGTTATGRSAVEWAREAASRGAGEILLTSIDRDGTREGFDCVLTAEVGAAVGVPVIASGGAGSASHIVDVLTRGGADAALAASILHFGDTTIDAIKRALRAAGVPVRLDTAPC
jgi:cyclase